MTNYNERLDKALSNLYNSAWIEGSNYEENNPEGSDIPSKREIAKTAQAKQAITALIKELVAEAKPSMAIISDEEMGIDRARKSAANNAIDQFEQNVTNLTTQTEM